VGKILEKKPLAGSSPSLVPAGRQPRPSIATRWSSILLRCARMAGDGARA